MRRVFARAAATALAVVVSWCLAVSVHGVAQGGGSSSAAPGAVATPFAAEIQRLSEPAGTFDTDNLISNESGYLGAIPALMSSGAAGGAYVGVGPDQNFSYIARVRPEVAFIVDIRRDNLLLHLLFKALFAHAHSRVEYLALLTGRAPPPDAERWTSADLKDIVGYIDGARPSPGAGAILSKVRDTIGGFGVPLSRADDATLYRFHREFIGGGLSLQFHSLNRPPQPFYPTLRQLILATDARGRMWNFLASEDDFQFLRALEGRDGVIPVVGDVAGPHAMRAIATAIAARNLEVSAFYISNVENYIFRDGLFPPYAANVTRLPRTPRTVVIRSIFSNGGQSVSVVQSLDEMAADIGRGRYRTYGDLISRFPHF